MKIYRNESRKNSTIIYKSEEFDERLRDVKKEIKTSVGALFLSGTGMLYSLANFTSDMVSQMGSNLTVLDGTFAGFTTVLTIASLINLKNMLKQKQMILEEEKRIIK